MLARIPEDELVALFEGYGHRPILVTGDDPEQVHGDFAAALDDALDDIARSTERARRRRAAALADDRAPHAEGLDRARARSTGCRWRAHGARTRCRSPTSGRTPEHLQLLEDWMRSYRPEELFDEEGRLVAELAALPPKGDERMSASPHANGGVLAAATSSCRTSATTRSR